MPEKTLTLEERDYVILTDAVASSTFGSWRALEYHITGKHDGNLHRKIKTAIKKMHECNAVLSEIGYEYVLMQE